jgi:2,4-dienoyl-CoA reductase-like NADH-dependent reductase (Old Yellow Enzyme family)
VAALEVLSDPYDLGGRRLRNRVFVSAHTTNFGEHNLPTARHAGYHRERARGGVGLIITEGVRVHPTSAARAAALGAFTPDCVPGYAQIPQAVHAEGAVVFAQLLHLGRHAAGQYPRTAAWAPSGDPWKLGAQVPHVMSAADIRTDEFLPAGLVVDHMIDIVGRLRDEFDLGFLHVSHSAYVGQYSLATQIADMTFPAAPFRAFPARFKAAFPQLPVLAVCRIDDLATAAEIVSAGHADLVGMARAHIADPHLLAKVGRGRADTVRSCIACNQGCIGRIEQDLPLSCVVNPAAGLEAEWADLERAATGGPRQRVLIVGGGPAGLEAACAAARMGHAVTLAEARERLGGAVRTAAGLRGRGRFQLLPDEQARAARGAGVEIRTGWPVSATDVLAGDWSAVIVATGAVERPGTFDGLGRARSVGEALSAPAALGDAVVVLDEEGTWAGAGLCEHLAAKGVRVHLVSPVGVAWNVTTYSRLALVRRLGELGVWTHRAGGWSGSRAAGRCLWTWSGVTRSLWPASTASYTSRHARRSGSWPTTYAAPVTRARSRSPATRTPRAALWRWCTRAGSPAPRSAWPSTAG